MVVVMAVRAITLPGAKEGLSYYLIPDFERMAQHNMGEVIFAAMSTVTAVFENIISFAMDLWNWSRKKACLVNTVLLIILSLPCTLGFNLLSEIQPIGAGSTILDLEDFIVSNSF